MNQNIEKIEELISIRDTWNRVGLLTNLDYPQQLILAQLLQDGAKFLTELSNNIYDEVDEFHMFKNNEDFAGLLLPAISRKFRTNFFKIFSMEDLIVRLNNNADLYYRLKQCDPKGISCDELFLDAII